ncbi:hypothetical protein OIO90_002270 [Microbotryomycetes sp. JL221]|nr:hypothetical protein OIO90_002270 [Microbotryomycetes sp. JL221]
MQPTAPCLARRVNGKRTDISKALPRMSWSASNLYNLYQRTYGPPTSETSFTKSSKTLFQQKWKAKQLVRAYHGDWLQEQKFKRHYLPDSLPPIVAPTASSSSAPPSSSRTSSRPGPRRSPQEVAVDSQKVPLASMMFSTLERRLDTVVFRCCFAHSVYRARQMVIHGNVKLNGRRVSDPNIMLQPGDLISVDPVALSTLKSSKAAKSATSEGTETKLESETAAESESGEAGAAKVVSSLPPPTQTRQQPLAFELPEFASPFLFVPPYLEVSWPTCSAIYLRDPAPGPGSSEVPSPYDADGEVMRLAWEYYVGLGRKGDKRPPGMVGKRLGA